MSRICAALFVFVTVSVQQAFAQSLNCEATLIVDTVKFSSDQVVKFSRLASINESNYSEVRTKLAGSLEIDGVPLGVSFSDFRKNRSQLMSDEAVSFYSRNSMNYFFTGLSDNALGAYRSCIEQRGKEGLGVQAWIDSLGTDDFSLVVYWNPGPANSTGTLQATHSATVSVPAFDKQSDAETWPPSTKRTYIIDRPREKDVRFAFNMGGFTKSLVVPGYFPPLLPDTQHVATAQLAQTNNGHGSNEESDKCIFSEKGWSWDVNNVVIVTDAVTDDSSNKLLSYISPGPMSADKICMHLVARGATQKSRGTVVGHFEANRFRWIPAPAK